jgi:protein XagA
MKNIVKHIILALLTFSITPSVLTAQAWTKSKGQGFYKLDFSSIQATDVFGPKGEIAPFRSLGNYTTSFYGEYGITDKIMAIAYVPFFVRNVVNETKGAQTGNIIEPGIVNNNFGDVDLGFRFALPIKSFAMSVNVLFGLPTGDAKQPDALFTGDGEFNQMIKIAAGTGKNRWWTQGALGFNNRTKGFSDEFRYDFEFGYKFFNDRLLTIFKINGIESFENGNAAAANTGLFSNNVEFAGIGPEILYYANAKKTIGISARIAGSLKGQNILAAPSMSIGVFAQF